MLFLVSMKNFRFLLMGVIGMIAFTATATTTAKLEQKKNTELASEFISLAFNVVVNDFQVVIKDSIQINSVFVQPVQKAKYSNSFIDFVTDVSWQTPGAKFTMIHYNEKLLENCNLDFVSFYKYTIKK